MARNKFLFLGLLTILLSSYSVIGYTTCAEGYQSLGEFASTPTTSNLDVAFTLGGVDLKEFLGATLAFSETTVTVNVTGLPGDLNRPYYLNVKASAVGNGWQGNDTDVSSPNCYEEMVVSLHYADGSSEHVSRMTVSTLADKYQSFPNDINDGPPVLASESGAEVFIAGWSITDFLYNISVPAGSNDVMVNLTRDAFGCTGDDDYMGLLLVEVCMEGNLLSLSQTTTSPNTNADEPLALQAAELSYGAMADYSDLNVNVTVATRLCEGTLTANVTNSAWGSHEAILAAGATSVSGGLDFLTFSSTIELANDLLQNRYLEFDTDEFNDTFVTCVFVEHEPEDELGGDQVSILDVLTLTGWWNWEGSCDPTTMCYWPVCGNGFVDVGESCDDGNNVTEVCAYGEASCTVCDSSCSLIAGDTSACGDGVVNMIHETCDDGNAETEICAYGEYNCSVCNSTCSLVPGEISFCGDGLVDPGEGCDDGNTETEVCAYGRYSCDVCDASCSQISGNTSFCGDGIVDLVEEECDDGNAQTEVCNGAPCTVCNSACALVAGDIQCPVGKVWCEDECQSGVVCNPGGGHTNCPGPSSHWCESLGACVESPLACIFNSTSASTGALLDSCTGTEILCWASGDCSQPDDCPVLDGCNDPTRPLSCGDGSCVGPEDTCTALDPCPAGSDRCSDGVCREVGLKECPESLGCPFEHPLRCPSGRCAMSLSDCPSSDDCAFPLCWDESCPANVTSCEVAPFLKKPAEIEFEVSLDEILEIVTREGEVLLEVDFPACLTNGSGLLSNATIAVKPVPDSRYNSTLVRSTVFEIDMGVAEVDFMDVYDVLNVSIPWLKTLPGDEVEGLCLAGLGANGEWVCLRTILDGVDDNDAGNDAESDENDNNNRIPAGCEAMQGEEGSMTRAVMMTRSPGQYAIFAVVARVADDLDVPVVIVFVATVFIVLLMATILTGFVILLRSAREPRPSTYYAHQIDAASPTSAHEKSKKVKTSSSDSWVTAYGVQELVQTRPKVPDVPIGASPMMSSPRPKGPGTLPPLATLHRNSWTLPPLEAPRNCPPAQLKHP